MPLYFVKLQRTVTYNGLVEAPSAASAAHKFGDQVRERPDFQVVSDLISEVRATQQSEPDED